MFDDESDFTKYISRQYNNAAAGIILDSLAMVTWGRRLAQGELSETDRQEVADGDEAWSRSLSWMIGDADGSKVERWCQLLTADPRSKQAIKEIWEHVEQAINNYAQSKLPVQ